MIKNNSFYKMWLLIIGMTVLNGTSLYGAENFDIYAFLESKETPTKKEAFLFKDKLEDLYTSCNDGTLTSCIQLNAIIKNKLFINRCETIFQNDDVLPTTKTKLADTCFLISEKILQKEEKKPIFNLIRSRLSAVTSVPLAIEENDPIQWTELAHYQKADSSIKAIKKLGQIIQDQNVIKTELLGNLLTKSLLGYLTLINDFFNAEQNATAKREITLNVNENQKFLDTLVKMTANDTIKEAYNSLKNYIPSLSSYEKLVPNTPQGSPTKSILQPDEIEKIASKKQTATNKTFFQDILDIIDLLNKNIEFNNIAEQEILRFRFEGIIYNWQQESIDDIKPILKTLFQSYKFQSALQKVRSEFSSIFNNRVHAFLLYLSGSEQQTLRPFSPILQPIQSPTTQTFGQQQQPQTLPTIAAATAFQGLSSQQTFQLPLVQPRIPGQIEQKTTLPGISKQLQHKFEDNPLGPNQNRMVSAQPSPHQLPAPVGIFNSQEVQDLNTIKDQDPSQKVLITNILDLGLILADNKQDDQPGVFKYLVKNISNYQDTRLSQYLKKIVAHPNFKPFSESLLRNQQLEDRAEFKEAYDKLKQLSTPISFANKSMPSSTFVQPIQHNKNWPSQPVKGSIIPRRKRTQLLKPLERKLSQEDFERQQNEFRNNINKLNINIALNNVISDEDIENIVTNLDLATCIDLFKLTRLFNALSTKQNRTDLKQHLQDYHLKPPYEGLLNEQEINTLSNNSFENNVIKEIDNFFVRGCPDRELKNFTSQVIQLAGLDLNNPYIIKIIDEPIFKNVCLFIYEGFDYPGKKKFDAAYERLFNIQVNKNPTSADISKTPLNPQSALPPTGNQAKQQPTVAKNLIPQKPTVGVPHPTPTVIPAAQNANPNPPSATPTNNNPTDNTGSGWSLRGIMSGAWSTLTSIPLIGTLLSSISNLISSFFTPSK